MSDISNVLRKVIELDISLGLDGTQEALDEITRLTSEVERLLSVTVVQETLIREAEAENEKLRAALDILQAAMTAKKPIPLAFKKAIIEARAALNHTTQQEK